MSGLISVAELEAMNVTDLEELFDSIADNQAVDSDIGRDSDADDHRIHPFGSGVRSSRMSTGNEGNISVESFQEARDLGPEQENGEPVRTHLFRSQDYADVDTDTESDENVDNNNFVFSKTASVPQTFELYDFNQEFGPKVEIDTSSPLAIFLALIADLLVLIVDQSNLYATQAGVNLQLSIEELKAFIGILIVMGFHQLPTIRLYWAADENFSVPRISNVMSLKRFLQILRFIHINDNSKMAKKGENGYDRLYKLRPLLNYLNSKFKSVFNPSRFLSIDESMVGFKGRSVLKQYLPMKPMKRGFKIWAIACATTGFLIGFQVYEGKTGIRRETTLGEEVVISLSQSFQHLGYCLFFDRFFTTLPLLRNLLSRNTFGCGTIMGNRKYFPTAQLCTDRHLRTGEMDFASSAEVSITKWKDGGTKRVLVASNMHTPTDGTFVFRRNKTGDKEQVNCPKCIYDYNKYMGGVDLFDQYISSYTISQKSRRWWMKIFYFLIDACIVNSYILYKTTLKLSSNRDKPLTHLMFRSILANELIHDFCSRPRKGRKSELVITKNKKLRKENGKGVTVNQLLNVGIHVPVKGTCRRCAYCSTKEVPKRSQIMCKSCGVNFCLECFAPFHEQ